LTKRSGSRCSEACIRWCERANDLGPVADALPAQRILLLLNRPPEREAALEQFLRDIHNRDSASYHQWITPEQFGQRFGPADADIQTAVSWLQSKGFTVARVAKSELFIDFTGTVSQLRNALDADIHQYNVQGEVDYANAHDLTVPAALGALVRGVSPLSNLRAKPYVKVAGQALYSTTSKRATPLWTLPNPFGTPNPYGFALAPEDLATQYDLTPLYQAGTDGSGQTIGIINESNIDVSLANAYRQLFGLPSNPTQVVIDGDDPGTLNNVDVEAYLDVELSGAVAPNATVNLYISNGSDFQDPIALVMLNGTATTTMTISASAQAVDLNRSPQPNRRTAWLSMTGSLMFGGILFGGFADRKRRPAALLTFAFLAVLLTATGCGSGGNSQTQPQSQPPPPANSATYSVLVTATGNKLVHTAKIIVVAD
jgi:Pro-kumamolisin, activation domain